MWAPHNKGLHQTGRGGVAHFVRRGPVVEARPAGEAQCSADLRGTKGFSKCLVEERQ